MFTYSRHIAVAATAVLAAISTSSAKVVTDTYAFKMTLQVPRVYDNTQSLGYRKYQRQTIKGNMYVTYDTDGAARPVFSFGRLVNQQHKVNGANVAYDVEVDDYAMPRLNAIGSNKTGIFKTPTAELAIQAVPSYAKGEPGEDNSLNVILAGKGTSAMIGSVRVAKRLSGSVAGSIGCSCSAYGHTSPTRVMGPFGPTVWVDDVSAVFGTWKAVLVSVGRR